MFGWLRKREEKRNDTPAPAAAPPVNAAAVRREADALLDRDDFAGAAQRYMQAIALDPADAKALTSLGFARSQLGQRAAAIEALDRAAALDPDSHDVHYMLGTLHEQAGDLGRAATHLGRSVELSPDFDLAQRDLARVLYRDGRPAQAREVLLRGIARNPRFADFHEYLGHIARDARDAAGAVAAYGDALAIDPRRAGTQLQLAVACEALGDRARAEAAYRAATALDARLAHAHNGLGNLLQRDGRLDRAIASYEAALAADPALAEAASNLGNVLRVQGRLEEAVRACRRAIAANPDLASAHNNLGNALVELKRQAEALPSYERALALQPDLVDAHVNTGQALNGLRRPKEALAAYERALAIDPRAPWVYGAWLHTRLGMCDWEDIGSAFEELARRIDGGECAAAPFTIMGAPLTATQQLRCAQTYVREMGLSGMRAEPLPPPSVVQPPRRIRLGYFSADFHAHATAHLMAELFELHDRERFEIIAFSFGPRSTHPMRKRLEAGFDRFIEVSSLPDAAIVARSREMGIDIAVDLKGFTQDARTGIFALRAAPVQVNYLGFPGSMGAPFIDYMVADATLVPPERIGDYSEKIAFLPNSYQVNDAKREVAARVFSREEAGLPAEGFVFCCLNNNYKITPDLFDVWMRLLQAVPGSVLWLLQDNAHAVANLRTEARSRGIDPDRLVFASRVEVPEHLARQRLADLFLDTLHCNAHTTASDALWVGLPVLTCMGEGFPSRVAASLVRAAGVHELVADNLAAYERLALELARDPARLAALKRRLDDTRLTCPLFDAKLFARHIEAAYTAMWQRHTAGLPPDHIRVGA